MSKKKKHDEDETKVEETIEQSEDEVEETNDEDEDEDEDEKQKKVEIEYEATMARPEAASYLDAVVAGLRAGHIEFRRGDLTLAMELPSHVELEIEVRQKGDKGKIELELQWYPKIQPLTIASEASQAGPADTDGDDD